MAATAFVVSFTAALGVAGMMLKHERKQVTKQITFQCSHAQWEAGECEPETVTCYRMADGQVICAQGVD